MYENKRLLLVMRVLSYNKKMENVMYIRLDVLVTNVCLMTSCSGDFNLYSRGWGRLFLLSCSLLEEFAFFLEKLVDLLCFLGTTT